MLRADCGFGSVNDKTWGGERVKFGKRGGGGSKWVGSAWTD